MGEDNSSSHGREIQAMTLNMKEQRVLQKRLQTLKLEESFRIKTLNIDKKQIKVFQKRLCTNVGKIKSYLSAEDISFMKNLEMEGRFKPEYNSVYISNAMTIIAAAKRLKLLSNEEIKKLTQDDFPDKGNLLLSDTPTKDRPIRNSKSANQHSRPQRPESTKVSEEITPLNIKRPGTGSATCRNNRSSSLPPEAIISRSRPTTAASKMTNTTTAKKFPHLLNSRNNTELDSVDGSRPRSRSSSRASDLDEAATMFRPTSSVSRQSARSRSRLDQSKVGSETARPKPSPPVPRPLTTGGYLTSRPRTARSPVRPKTSLGIGLETPGLNYSSHKTINLQQPKNERSSRRISVMSSSSLGSEMAKEKAEEFRKELMIGEQNRSDHIEEKRQGFMNSISKWVDENPAIVDKNKPKYAFISASDIEMMKAATVNVEVIQNEGLFDEDKDWKDLKKCRYLRMAEDDVDLSGINTLARDNLQMLQGFRTNYDLPRKVNNGAAAVK